MTHSMNQYLAINKIFCDKMWFQNCTYLTINESIFPCWTIPQDDQRWITLRAEALSNADSCHQALFHHLYTVEIIYKYCKLRICFSADYTISLSSLCRLIWRHWTAKMLVRYMMPSVSKIKTILSIIFYSIYGAVCLQLTRFSCDDRENVYFILLSSSNRKYESLTIV